MADVKIQDVNLIATPAGSNKVPVSDGSGLAKTISVDQITTLVDEVETSIFNREDKEIPSYIIGEILMDKLKGLDPVAYVRFASVYREFKDVNTFMDELKKILNEPK